MNGFGVLEDIIYSLDETKSSGGRVYTFREVVDASTTTVRRFLQTGAILGVQEFSPDVRINDLIKDNVDAKFEYFSSPKSLTHLYKVRDALSRAGNCPITPLVFIDDQYSGENNSRICKISSAFDSVCRDADSRFCEELKPSVKYSIITPVMKLEFPSYNRWREGHYSGYPKKTDNTAVVRVPFSIQPNQEFEDIMDLFRQTKKNEAYLESTSYCLEQAKRVIDVVRSNENFMKLTRHFVELSEKMDELARQEHLAGIR